MKVGFGFFELDSSRRQLLREGRDVHLTPKAFDLLTTLIEAVSDALRESLPWLDRYRGAAR